MKKNNLYYIVLAAIMLLLGATAYMQSISSADLVSIPLIVKSINALTFFVFLSIFLRLFDKIIEKNVDEASFFDNDIASGIYFGIRFFATALGIALVVM